MKTYMAIDQYGNTIHGLTHPRKDLMDKLGYKSANKMYTENKDGESRHAGYVVGPHWCSVYEVCPLNSSEKAQGMVEYMLIIGLLAIVAIVVLTVLGPELKEVYTRLMCALPNVPPEIICAAVTN